ncbi:MAG: hypothetical protein CME62_12470 [Halobacteriovoraceae bacterium]|nr:hypothetical protein [Halobacteriovoraceae bacterium]|tara:strand:- start:5952 stop:6323 length:372 start_codon:yes stop_codon:yes gene_type:complete
MNILYPVDLNKNIDFLLKTFIEKMRDKPVKILLLKTYHVDQVEGRCVIETNDMFKKRLQRDLNHLKSQLQKSCKRIIEVDMVLKIGSLKHVIPNVVDQHQINYIFVNDGLKSVDDFSGFEKAQ